HSSSPINKLAVVVGAEHVGARLQEPDSGSPSLSGPSMQPASMFSPFAWGFALRGLSIASLPSRFDSNGRMIFTSVEESSPGFSSKRAGVTCVSSGSPLELESTLHLRPICPMQQDWIPVLAEPTCSQ